MNKYWLPAPVVPLLSLLCGLGATVSAYASQPTELDCIVEPEMIVELSSSVDGIVQGVTVDKSDRVEVGQVLATLESSVEQAAVELARLRSEGNEEVDSARIQRDLSKRKKERIQELYKKKSVPLFEKDVAEAEASLAELELKRSINRKKMAAVELKSAEANLKLRSIVSPIDGVVVDRYVHPGESVADTPVLKLAQIDPMRIEIIALSDLFGLVSVGMDVEVTVEGRTDTVHTARVSVVDSIVDAASGTFGIRLNLPNPDNAVVGGVKCRARFKL